MSHAIMIHESTTVDLPAEATWKLIADYSNDLRWRNGLTEMTPTPDGPPAVGTKLHEVLRSMGSTYTTDTTVTSVGDRSYRFAGDGTSGRVEGGRSVTSVGAAQSEFTYDIELTLSGATRLLRPLVGPMMRRNLRKDLQHFRALAENKS